jgi:hypothetical protein
VKRSATKKPTKPTTKPDARKVAGKKPAGKKPAATKAVAKQPAAKKAVAKKPAPRADLGKPIDGFFAKQPAHLRAILVELRAMVEAAAPDAASSIKWGMPFFTLDGATMCALGAHKSHVNLIMSGPPGTYADPEGRLSGDGKTGRHLKLTSLDELPREAVRAWLRTAAKQARQTR